MRLILTLLIAVLTFGGGAAAAVIPIGAQLGPVPGGSGTGTLVAYLDDTAMTLQAEVHFSGLSAPTTGGPNGNPDPPAHIHRPAGSIVVPFTGFPTNVTNGHYMNTLTLTSAQVTELLTGLTSGGYYLNVHTTAIRSGEIRGDIAAIPEPGTTFLLASGLAGLLAFKLRKKTT